MLRLRLWPKTGIDPAWPILSVSCRHAIKTGTAGVRGDHVIRAFENLDAGITRASHHLVVVDVLAIRRTN